MMFRQDVSIVPIQEHVYVKTFFKNLPNGKGFSFSLYIHNMECIKYDCQGINGHFHIYHTSNQKQETKIHFPRHTTYWGKNNQIDFAMTDFENHVHLYLTQSLVPVIQTFPFSFLSPICSPNLLIFVIYYGLYNINIKPY